MRSRGEVVLCVERREKAAEYVEALKAGGLDGERLRVITPESGARDAAHLRSVAAGAAGLLVCGGPDIAPERYGEQRRVECHLRVVEELDAIEFELMAGAEAGSTPVLGVCRGLQLINVYMGGTLHQDVPSEVDDSIGHRVREPLSALAHEVTVSDDSLPIGNLYGRAPVEVNSRHHQAVKRLGRELEPAGHAPDGVLEIVQSHPRHSWWRWAVQWHPENLVGHEVHRRLWRAFVDRALHPARTAPDASTP